MSTLHAVSLSQGFDEESLYSLEMRHSSGSYRKRPLVIERGEGEFLFDSNGKRYLDCITGIGAAILGHNHPALINAVTAQASTLLSAPELLCTPMRARYQQRLLDSLPPGYDRVFLCNSGTEANEAALKFARLASGRTDILALAHGYHGKTLGSLSVTANEKYRAPFEPLIPGVTHLRKDDREQFREVLNSRSVGAFIFEAIQGEGGVLTVESGYLRECVAQVRESGGFSIADEVQTGFGRTGKMFGFEHCRIEPDFVCMAKGIAGGIPMGAVAIHQRVCEIPPLSHTSTFGGNPLACAAGLAVLETLQSEGLVERAFALGERFRSRLSQQLPRGVREIRGQGLMIGLELKRRAQEPLALLQERGILALLAGNRVLRFLPPLTISHSSLDYLVEQLREVLQ